MPRRNILFTISVLAMSAVGLAISPAGLAQGRRGIGRPSVKAQKAPKAPKVDKNSTGHLALDDFVRMSPEERQKALAKLPPERADKLRKQLKDYSNMTPQQQAAAREQLGAFRNLSPEQQEGMRKAFAKFSREPADRQQVMRQELNQLGGLSEAERQSRLNSPEFKERFNNNQRKIIREMSDLMPKQ